MSLPESALSSNPHEAAPQADVWGRARRRIGAVLYVLLCVEIGTFLVVLPWSGIWEGNVLLRYYPSLRPLYMSSYLRGAVSGLGLINIWLGIAQAWRFRRPASCAGQ